MIKRFVAFTFLIALMNTACAEGYFGLDYSSVDISDGGLSVKPTALNLKIGAGSKNAAIEFRAGLPLQDDSVTVAGIAIDMEAKYFGLLGRFGTGDDNASVYGLFGLMDVTLEGSARGVSVDVSESDLVYGFGLNVGNEKGFSLEYILGSGDLDDVSSLSLGFFTRF